MAFKLGDDGTMDTILYCEHCGEEMRFNYDRSEPIERDDTGKYIVGNCRYQTEEQAAEADYDLFIESCCEEAEADHECIEDGDTNG